MTKKGRRGEYEAFFSLKPVFPDITLTAERGFQKQFDLSCSLAHFEVKKHRAFSWNELVKFWQKLRERTPQEKHAYLIFIANRQPALVMFKELAGFQHIVDGPLAVKTFTDVFHKPWIPYKDVPKVNRHTGE